MLQFPCLLVDNFRCIPYSFFQGFWSDGSPVSHSFTYLLWVFFPPLSHFSQSLICASWIVLKLEFASAGNQTKTKTGSFNHSLNYMVYNIVLPYIFSEIYVCFYMQVCTSKFLANKIKLCDKHKNTPHRSSVKREPFSPDTGSQYLSVSVSILQLSVHSKNAHM